MLSETQAIYELWEEESPVSPPHSRLYHLEPIGVGSPMVESLTSYVIRLADAHSVHPRTLFTEELFPRMKRSYLYSEGHTIYDHLTTFWTQSSNLNGTGISANSLVQALEQLTHCSHLHFLTMLPWKEVLATRKLLRRTRAWCVACYEEWRKKQQPIYEPLLWMLDVIRLCPKHRQLLRTCCPFQNCARTLSPLAPRAQPGYCPWCNRWLGYVSMEEQPLIAHLEELEHQQWLVQTIGDVFASLPFTIGSLSKDGLMTTLNYCIAEAGNLFAATRWLGTHQKSLDMMVHEGRTPSLAILLRLCARLEMPLLHFVTGNLATAPKFLSQAQTASKDAITIGPKRKLRKFDSQRMRHELEAILHSSGEPPPSMREVGRRLEYHATHLSHRFPELCQMISARYITYRREQKRQRLQKLCEEVRRAIFAICAQGKYPSNVRVSEMMGNYPLFRHQPLYETWKSTLRELGLKS